MAKPKLDLKGFAAGVIGSATGTTPPKIDATPPKPDAMIELALIDIKPQVRTKFPEPELKQLAASIKAQGVLVPVVLHRKGRRYEMIAGERRYRAAEIAEIKELPAIIKEGLTPRQIREIQVTENNERENLSVYDECLGVLQDIEDYGFEAAKEIWNRSDAWISKRGGVKKLAEPVLSMLRDETVADLEIAITLNKIYEINQNEFDALAAKMGTDDAPSREAVRDKLTALREWAQREKDREKAKKLESQKTPLTPNEQDKRETEADPAVNADASGAKGKTAPAPAVKANAQPQPASGKSSSEPAPKSNVVPLVAQPQQGNVELLDVLRSDFYEWGITSREQLEKIQALADKLELDMNETEFVLWASFLSTLLPMIDVVGQAKAESFLKKLLADLKKKPAAQMWAEQHPPIDGKEGTSHNDRVKVPMRPKGWRL